MTALEQFVASLVHSLAWPVAVVVLAVVFRRQLSKLLDAPLSRLKAGPVELEFARVLASAESEVEGVIPRRAPGVSDELDDLVELAHQMPTAAVLEAGSRLEHRLRELIKEHGPDPGSLGLRGLARAARDREFITVETLKAIEGIVVLRNLAAHNRTSALPVERALEYINLVDAVLYSLRPLNRPD